MKKYFDSPVVVNKKSQAYDVYIGRGSKWGNPFRIDYSTGYTRDKVIEMYREYMLQCISEGHFTFDDFRELANKKLGCYCYPNNCHGNVLVEIFNTIYEIDNNIGEK